MLRIIAVLIFLCGFCRLPARAQGTITRPDSVLAKVDEEVIRLMREGDIPGLSLVIDDGERQLIKCYGFADVGRQRPVTEQTLFELGSCSKAFTALAVMQLVNKGIIRLDAPVTSYIPWFRVSYKDSVVPITVLQLLHHTSGIPWQTIASIPRSSAPDALDQTVRRVSGVRLHHLPGKNYEYSTINYDILALIIEKVSGMHFEDYLQVYVLDALRLGSTTVGIPRKGYGMATGYKIGFFQPRAYVAPVYRGNYAAGYVLSNAVDMGKWLRFQMGMAPEGGLLRGADSGMYRLAELTHERDETVAIHDMAAYGMGWEVSLNGDRTINHGGLNPNFTAYVGFRTDRRLGVVVLANSNSGLTPVIGTNVIKLLAGDKPVKQYDPGEQGDRGFSLISFGLGAYMLVILGLLGLVLTGILKGRRKMGMIGGARGRHFVYSLFFLIPFLFGLYLLPRAVAGFTWDSIGVWTPLSFLVMVRLMIGAVGLSYLTYLISLVFRGADPFRESAPKIVLISLLSGISNIVVILLVTSSLETSIELRYLIFYYGLTLAIYLFARRFVQISLIRFTRGLIYDLRMKMMSKIFSTSYMKFERIDRGRIYTALNDDVDTIGNSSSMFIMLITNVITSAGAFLYLACIAFWAAMLVIFLIVTLAVIYYLVSRSTRKYYDAARDSRNLFMGLLNGMIDGFKEISLHRRKKLDYKADVAETANEYREKVCKADIMFVNAFLVGESLLLVLLGAVAFAVPKLFPGIKSYTVMSFVIVMLYLIGPINEILNSVPSVMQLRVAWNRIRKFLAEIPANLELTEGKVVAASVVDSIRAEGIVFRYQAAGEQDGFIVGPVDLEVRRGEILFLIGGNGSGKTTLAKLLTGLYTPDGGRLRVNGRIVEANELSEYFSTVFSPPYLFEKLYTINAGRRKEEVNKYLRLLNLDEKVKIEDNKYSTISLSGGQRKRLALLQCYLEDSPIYLFDEWAADQDPEYRNFFYRTLLPEMRRAGKIVIAITHDDHYFDVADRVMKMNRGKLEPYSEGYLFADGRLKGDGLAATSMKGEELTAPGMADTGLDGKII